MSRDGGGAAAPVGLTQDAGWQIGVSRTVDHPVEEVWGFLTSPAGRAVWLGHGVDVLDGRGRAYRTADGTAGEVRSLHDHDRIRLTWRPEGWDHDSTVQVTVRAAGAGRTVLRFHQDRLADAAERARQRAHWRAVLGSVVAALDAAAPG
ncbi:SRPBCC family protein [Kineococcus sp. NUM-3379]